MHNENHKKTSAEVVDCGQRLMDISESLTYPDLSDEIEDIEIRIDSVIQRMEALKMQIKSLAPTTKFS